MHCEIYTENKIDECLAFVMNKLPKSIRTSILQFLSKNHFPEISEMRLHSNSYISFIGNSKNLRTDIFTNQSQINEIINVLCNGSIYAHFDTIKDGYINLGMGIRAGVCGRASTEDGNIVGICEITAINIRLPKRILHSADYLFSILEESGFNKSIIIYSRPGVGKTTILRELLYLLSNCQVPIRHSVIDSREEITPFMNFCHISADIFISYPKGLAIEIATKTMTPELIICDEITSINDATAVLNSSNCGVKLIATSHAGSFDELCSKEILQGLFEHNVFDFALGVFREIGSKKYQFTLDKLWLKFLVVY